MGMGGVSVWQLVIILLIATMVFGTGRLKNMGEDLGGALKGFKKALNDDSDDNTPKPSE